jgi:thioredoxin 1
VFLKRRVLTMVKVIKFENPTCVPCKAVEAILTGLKEKMGFNLVHVDTYTDEGAELAQRYRVMSTPTVIIENDKGHLDVIPYVADTREYQERIAVAM